MNGPKNALANGPANGAANRPATGLVRYTTYSFSFPASEPPAWAAQVERWYQLDAFAFGLPQAVSKWGLDLALQERKVPAPAFLILSSPEGSNRTDFDFAQSFLRTGTGSPSKFVHTLPNSRSASLLQVLGWSGPLLCLQNDPATFVTALEEAIRLSTLRAGTGWIFGVTRIEDASYRVHLFEITPEGVSQGVFGGGAESLGHGAASGGEFRWQAEGIGVKSTLKEINQSPGVSGVDAIDRAIDDSSVGKRIDPLYDDQLLIAWLNSPAMEFKRAFLGLQISLQKGLPIEKQ